MPYTLMWCQTLVIRCKWIRYQPIKEDLTNHSLATSKSELWLRLKLGHRIWTKSRGTDKTGVTVLESQMVAGTHKTQRLPEHLIKRHAVNYVTETLSVLLLKSTLILTSAWYSKMMDKAATGVIKMATKVVSSRPDWNWLMIH